MANTRAEAVAALQTRIGHAFRDAALLERALTQRNAAGQPVLVEPDPEVVTLQGQFGLLSQRLEDLEATVRRINGDNERLTFQLDEAQRDNAALRTRIVDAEGRIEKLERAAELNAPIEANSPTGDAGQDLAAAVRLMGEDRARGARGEDSSPLFHVSRLVPVEPLALSTILAQLSI